MSAVDRVKDAISELSMNDKARLLQCVFCHRDALICGCDETDEDAKGLCKEYQGAVIFEPKESQDKDVFNT